VLSKRSKDSRPEGDSGRQQRVLSSQQVSYSLPFTRLGLTSFAVFNEDSAFLEGSAPRTASTSAQTLDRDGQPSISSPRHLPYRQLCLTATPTLLMTKLMRLCKAMPSPRQDETMEKRRPPSDSAFHLPQRSKLSIFRECRELFKPAG
jgi:hypothetical protein